MIKKVIFILVVLVSIISAGNIYLRNGTVYENFKLVEENKRIVKVKLYKNNIKQFYVPKILIKEIIQSNPDTLKKSVFYTSKLVSAPNLASSSNFNSEINK